MYESLSMLTNTAPFRPYHYWRTLMEHISDMENYIQSRRRKGKTARQIHEDLQNHGYDHFAAHALVMLHWYTQEEKDAQDAAALQGASS